MAGVVLLAALFARPYWSVSEFSAEDHSVIVLIDRSASMGAGRNGKTPWDLARKRAREITRAIPAGTALHLAYFDASGVTPASPGDLETSGSVSLAGTDYGPALTWARDLAVAAGNSRCLVYLVSDLQRSGIRRPIDNPLPDSAMVTIVDVGRPLTRNLAVDDVQVEQTDLRPGTPVTVAARIANCSPFPARGVRLTLSLDGISPGRADGQPRSPRAEGRTISAAARTTRPLPRGRQHHRSGRLSPR